MFGLGKPMSKFGKFLRRNEITQTDLWEWSGINQNTISRISRSNEYKPSLENGQKIIKALRRRRHKVDFDNFWSI
ncbi:transcriptional regulator [Bacillus manliponensis]|uniref:transcriptional regulator n=1 Tax=Bacillus manliponensis TaxID=574376 RepID=UPI003514D127